MQIPIEKIIGKRRGPRKTAVNRWKNYGASSSNAPSMGSLEDLNGGLATVYNYLQAAGANPSWGPNGQILGADPTNPGKLTTSIKKLRRNLTPYTSQYNDPVWNYIGNVLKGARAYRSVVTQYGRYGGAEGAFKKSQYNAQLRFLRKGYKYANDPGLLDAKAAAYRAAAQRAGSGFSTRFGYLDQANRAAASNYVQMYQGQRGNFGFRPEPPPGPMPVIAFAPANLNSTMILE